MNNATIQYWHLIPSLYYTTTFWEDGIGAIHTCVGKLLKLKTSFLFHLREPSFAGKTQPTKKTNSTSHLTPQIKSVELGK